MKGVRYLFYIIFPLALASLACALNTSLLTPQPVSLEADLPFPSATAPGTPLPGSGIASPEASPDAPAGSTRVSAMDGMVLAYIPAGSFLLGESAERGLAECLLLYTSSTCDRGWFANEEPVHRVRLDAFYLDAYEVTNAQYAQCVAAGGCVPPWESSSYTRPDYYGAAAYANYPVINVNWIQAASYCAWAGRRLPTEAEWEAAARGGLEGSLYPWGDVFDGTLANFCDLNCSFTWSNPDYDDGYFDTAPLASYPANGYGVFDLAGNVGEWVADWEGAYPADEVANPTGAAEGEARVTRGGSWNYYGSYLRVAVRNPLSPEAWNSNLGFRCALWP